MNRFDLQEDDSWKSLNEFYSTLILCFLVFFSFGRVGIISASGLQWIFVTLFTVGGIPFSILLASFIVQDGHATLPLPAICEHAFLWIKLMNIAFGLLLGLVLLYIPSEALYG